MQLQNGLEEIARTPVWNTIAPFFDDHNQKCYGLLAAPFIFYKNPENKVFSSTITDKIEILEIRLTPQEIGQLNYGN